MGDAIARGLPEAGTPRVMIVWGDQAALRPETLERGMRLLDGPLAPAAVCPTVWRRRPYIHFARSSDGRLDRVLQSREGDPMPAEGESDAGLFFFDTPTLRRRLGALAGSPESVGARTGESNFLPLLALMDRGGDAVLCPRIVTVEESAGVNSREDAGYLEGILAARTGKES
jgi:bifunctional N-acetylglucosamine-1-phosphate-uridyltransferase/glucosamine-1-phosphate-acetyltransferase GlmU-like protein